jgi:hypothetical protein
MAIFDRHGLPLSVSTHAANHYEVRLVQLCFDFYMIEAKPENLIGDRAYDSDPLDEELRRDGIEMIAPHPPPFQFLQRGPWSVLEDFINGIGNVSADPNPRWFPSVLLTLTSSGVLEDGPLAFAIAATELFAATLLCGRALSISLTVSIAAGWLITLSTWPLFVMPKIVTLWFFSPTHAEILSVSVIVTTAALYICARPIWRSILLTAIAFLGITHIVLGAPTNLSLVGPFIAILAGISILSSNRNGPPSSCVGRRLPWPASF